VQCGCVSGMHLARSYTKAGAICSNHANDNELQKSSIFSTIVYNKHFSGGLKKQKGMFRSYSCSCVVALVFFC